MKKTTPTPRKITPTKKTAPVEPAEGDKTEKALVKVKETSNAIVKKSSPTNHIPDNQAGRHGTIKREIARVLKLSGQENLRVSAEFVDEISRKVNNKIVGLLGVTHTIMKATKHVTMSEGFFDCALAVIKAVNANEELAGIV